MGDRQDEPGDRVVQGPRPPGARAAAAGPGVGVVGMCFTGNFALAMLPEPAVKAPVLSQPSLPLGFTKKAQRGALPQRGGPRGGAGPHGDGARPVPARPAVHRRSPRAQGLASTTCARRSATGSWRWRSTRRRATRTGTRPLAHSVLTEHLVDEPGQPTRDALEQVLDLFRTRLLPRGHSQVASRARPTRPGPSGAEVPGGPAMPVAESPSGRTRSSVPASVGVAEVGHLAADLGALHLEDPGGVDVGDEVGERLGRLVGGRPDHLHRERHAVGPGAGPREAQQLGLAGSSGTR